jgi:hypothetical protein
MSISKIKLKKKKTKTSANHEEMKLFDKKYKKTLDKNMRLYRKKKSIELRNLRKSNSKEYWKMLNRGKTKTEPNIPIESLFEYFKNLSETPIENDKAFSFPNEI